MSCVCLKGGPQTVDISSVFKIVGEVILELLLNRCQLSLPSKVKGLDVAVFAVLGFGKGLGSGRDSPRGNGVCFHLKTKLSCFETSFTLAPS